MLLFLLSEIYSIMNRSQLTLFVLYEASAAFDTVDHDIILQRLESSCGIRGPPFFSGIGRTLLVVLKMVIRWRHYKSSGLGQTWWPQGSVMGSLLHLLHTAHVPAIFCE